MPARFRTVAGPGQCRFEIRGSEFIGHVDRVNSVDAAEEFIEAVRMEYDDASHNVPAYRVPAGEASPKQMTEVMLREYQSDNGEPSGSSGKPALNVLQQRDLRNIVAVVTRYYGGTNLGVGGLARAYSRAVKDAVDDAGVTEQQPRHQFTVTVEYDDSGTVRGLLEGVDCEFDAAYEADVAFEVSVRVDESEELQDRIRSATSGRATIE